MAESGGAILNDGLAYIAGLSPGGSNVANNTGNLLVVNIADPESMSPIRSLSIPGTFELLHVAIDGNRALVIGAAGQENGMIHTDPTGLFNKLSLTLLDISDPDNPQILGSTLVTNDQFPFNEAGYNINVVSLGNGQYALGGIYANGKPSLLVVHAGNSDQLVVSTIPAPSSVHRVTVVGDELYATTASGLSIYHVGQLVPDPVTITVNLPAGGAAQIIPDSYNVAPTQVTTSATGDSLIWNRNFQPGLTSYTFSWQSTVDVAAAGRTVPITLGAGAAFTIEGTSGTTGLPGKSVTVAPIIAVTSIVDTVQPGGSATYDVALTNPTVAQVTYAETVDQAPAGSAVSLPPSVTVAAGATVHVLLTLATSVIAAVGSFSFTVSASAAQNAAGGSAGAALKVAGTPVIQPDPVAHGIVAALTPAQASAGQGSAAKVVVRLTNTGSVDDTLRWRNRVCRRESRSFSAIRRSTFRPGRVTSGT